MSVASECIDTAVDMIVAEIGPDKANEISTALYKKYYGKGDIHLDNILLRFLAAVRVAKQSKS